MPDEITIITRMEKIQTSNCTCTMGSWTAIRMKMMSATPVTPYVSKPSAEGPTESPALSPVQSAITPGLRTSSSLILKTIFMRSEPMSAILVKMPPATRKAAAPSDSPMAKPMKQEPASEPGMKSRMKSMMSSSTEIGDLGEDAAGHRQGAGAERFTDGEADEAGAGKRARNEEQDEEHDEQLNRDQEHADAHAGLQGNVVAGIGFAAKRSEGGARVGEGVNAHAEGRHGEAAGNADDAEQQDDRDLIGLHLLQVTEIENDDDRDEAFQKHQELELGGEVGLARFVDQLGTLDPGGVNGHILEAVKNDEAKNQAESADHQARHEQGAARDIAQEVDGAEIRQLEICLTGGLLALRQQRDREQ